MDETQNTQEYYSLPSKAVHGVVRRIPKCIIFFSFARTNNSAYRAAGVTFVHTAK